MNTTIALLGDHGGSIPVVVIESVTLAPRRSADALVQGGLPLRRGDVAHARRRRTPCAPSPSATDMVVGAGSVRTAEQVDRAVEAGARFIVSPGFSDGVVAPVPRRSACPSCPGVATATEIMRALDVGLDVVKLFPAGSSAGRPRVRTLAPRSRSVRFVPTGGVGPANLAEYLSIPAVARRRRQLDGRPRAASSGPLRRDPAPDRRRRRGRCRGAEP